MCKCVNLCCKIERDDKFLQAPFDESDQDPMLVVTLLFQKQDVAKKKVDATLSEKKRSTFLNIIGAEPDFRKFRNQFKLRGVLLVTLHTEATFSYFLIITAHVHLNLSLHTFEPSLRVLTKI